MRRVLLCWRTREKIRRRARTQINSIHLNPPPHIEPPNTHNIDVFGGCVCECVVFARKLAYTCASLPSEIHAQTLARGVRVRGHILNALNARRLRTLINDRSTRANILYARAHRGRSLGVWHVVDVRTVFVLSACKVGKCNKRPHSMRAFLYRKSLAHQKHDG